MSDLINKVRPEHRDLYKRLEKCLSARNVSKTYLGKMACGNTMLFERLEAGRGLTVRTVLKLNSFLDEAEVPADV